MQNQNGSEDIVSDLLFLWAKQEALIEKLERWQYVSWSGRWIFPKIGTVLLPGDINRLGSLNLYRGNDPPGNWGTDEASWTKELRSSDQE